MGHIVPCDGSENSWSLLHASRAFKRMGGIYLEGSPLSVPTIVEERATEAEKTYKAYVICLENAVLSFFNDSEAVRLGTLSVSMPSTIQESPSPISSTIMGERHVVLSRVIAEHIASATGRISLASVNLRTTDEKKASPHLVRLSQKIVEKLRR